MEMLVAKLLGLLALFSLMLAGVLVPVRLLLADGGTASSHSHTHTHTHRYGRALSLGNSFGGGVFLATCFNALLPTIRDKVSVVFQKLQITSDFPVAEATMMLGFFLTVFIEQLVLTLRKEKPSFIDLDTFNNSHGLRYANNANSESEEEENENENDSQDSEFETPFINNSERRSKTSISTHRNHGNSIQTHSHSHGATHLSAHDVKGAGILRLASLVLALSAHSVFEGLALGLQDNGAKLASLFLGVAIHETLAAVALGVSVAKASLGMKDAAKLAFLVSVMIPIGALIGAGIESAQTLAASITSVILQGLAAGTFLFVTFFEILSRELDEKQDRLLKVLFLVLGYTALAVIVFIKW